MQVRLDGSLRKIEPLAAVEECYVRRQVANSLKGFHSVAAARNHFKGVFGTENDG